jgi:membrane associated rhomboid family serine protease
VFPLTDGMPPRRFPIVTVAIIVACFAVWIFYELPHLNSSVNDASFYTCDVTGSCDAPLPWAVSWFTAMFMHASWSHILGNMWFLAIFGKNVEDSFGRLRYFAMYVAGGFAATAAQAVVTVIAGTVADEKVPMLGASGALAAVLGAYWILYPEARILTIVLVFPVRIPAWVFLGVWFLYNVISGHMGLVNGGDDGGTAFFAHVGGFVFGVGAALALRRSRPEPEGRLQPAGY